MQSKVLALIAAAIAVALTARAGEIIVTPLWPQIGSQIAPPVGYLNPWVIERDGDVIGTIEPALPNLLPDGNADPNVLAPPGSFTNPWVLDLN